MTQTLTPIEQPMPARGATPAMKTAGGEHSGPASAPDEKADGQGFLACLLRAADSPVDSVPALEGDGAGMPVLAGETVEADVGDLFDEDMAAMAMGKTPSDPVKMPTLETGFSQSEPKTGTASGLAVPHAGAVPRPVPTAIPPGPAVSVGDTAGAATPFTPGTLSGDMADLSEKSDSAQGVEPALRSTAGKTTADTASPAGDAAMTGKHINGMPPIDMPETPPATPLKGGQTHGAEPSAPPVHPAGHQAKPTVGAMANAVPDAVKTAGRNPATPVTAANPRQKSGSTEVNAKGNPALETIADGAAGTDTEPFSSLDPVEDEVVIKTPTAGRNGNAGAGREGASLPAPATVKTDPVGSDDAGRTANLFQAAEKTEDGRQGQRLSASTPRSVQTGVVNQLVDRAVLIHRNGQAEVRIDLKPEYLGRIQMKIATENQRVTVHLLAESPMAREIVEASLGQLRTDLAGQGLEIDRFEVDLFASADSEHRDGTGSAGHRRGGRQAGGRSRSAIDDTESRNASHTVASSVNGDGAIDYFA
jgi:flagellar hook-length control protein FliK